MPQLLPLGMADPVQGNDVATVDQSITYGETWGFHMGHLCSCGKEYPHLNVYGGRVEKVSGVDTLSQWIRFALSTERFLFPIYTDQFGVEFAALVERSPTAEEVMTEGPRMIREALSIDPRITEVREVRLEELPGDPSSFLVEMEVVTFTTQVEVLESRVQLEV